MITTSIRTNKQTVMMVAIIHFEVFVSSVISVTARGDGPFWSKRN